MQRKKRFFLLLLFRTKVNSAKPKLRISEQNAKEKTKFLISFPNESDFDNRQKYKNFAKNAHHFHKLFTFAV